LRDRRHHALAATDRALAGAGHALAGFPVGTPGVTPRAGRARKPSRMRGFLLSACHCNDEIGGRRAPALLSLRSRGSPGGCSPCSSLGDHCPPEAAAMPQQRGASCDGSSKMVARPSSPHGRRRVVRLVVPGPSRGGLSHRSISRASRSLGQRQRGVNRDWWLGPAAPSPDETRVHDVMIMPENWRLGWLGPAVPRRRAWEAAPLPDRAGGDSAIGQPNEELSPNFPGTCPDAGTRRMRIR
jgi:hypothetical protein